MRAAVIVMLACGLAGSAYAQQPKSDALAILERAISKQKQPKELAQALAELDAILAKNPRDPDAHYARGWVLSRSGKSEDAVAAYDRAFALDVRLADAPYNAGVVLGRMGNLKEAIVRFERALGADPKHVDAAYNAGQSYYDIGEYAKAAQRWTTAMKLAPEDFQTAKKLVQAYVAVGKPADIKRARARVVAMWKAGRDPEIQKLKSYVYDQFVAGKYYVYVYEAFETTGDLAYVYQFKVTQNDKTIGSVNLETSALIREQGTPYVIGIDKDGEHITLAQHAWKKLPEYKTLKALALRLIETRF